MTSALLLAVLSIILLICPMTSLKGD